MRLEAKHIGFHYGSGPWILRDIDLQVDSGEVVGLTGPSGYGKTTLGRILAGYLQPHEGIVCINEQPLSHHGYSPVQLICQHPEKAVNPRWRMRDTLQEGGAAEEVCSEIGIEKEWLDRWPNELSGGELQRFCVARALNPKTRYLIADEMTTMLDAVTQAQIWHVAFNFAQRNNMGIVVISHEENLLKRLCHRIIMLEKVNKAGCLLYSL